MNSVGALYNAVAKSYKFLTPDLWESEPLEDTILDRKWVSFLFFFRRNTT